LDIYCLGIRMLNERITKIANTLFANMAELTVTWK
jgi:hypothetical protein